MCLSCWFGTRLSSFTSLGAKGRQGETFPPAHTHTASLSPPAAPCLPIKTLPLAGCSIRARHLITATSWLQPKGQLLHTTTQLKVSSHAAGHPRQSVPALSTERISAPNNKFSQDFWASEHGLGQTGLCADVGRKGFVDESQRGLHGGFHQSELLCFGN